MESLLSKKTFLFRDSKASVRYSAILLINWNSTFLHIEQRYLGKAKAQNKRICNYRNIFQGDD